MRSLWASEGEVRPGEVVSTRSGCGILAGYHKAGLYSLPSSAWSEIRPCWIAIGCWTGRLWMLRACEMLGMLHWGTPRASGWLAGSRRASSCAQMMMMLLLLSTGSHFVRKFAGFCWGREIFFSIFSWRDGSRVSDPVEVTFQGRSCHITPS